MSKRTTVVVSALVLALGVGLLEAQAARKHRHPVKMSYFQKEGTMPAGQAGSQIVFCPRRSTPTGGGATYEDGLLYLVHSGLTDPVAGWAVIYINESANTAGRFNVQVACVKNRTAATAATAASADSREEARENLRERVRELRAELE